MGLFDSWMTHFNWNTFHLKRASRQEDILMLNYIKMSFAVFHNVANATLTNKAICVNSVQKNIPKKGLASAMCSFCRKCHWPRYDLTISGSVTPLPRKCARYLPCVTTLLKLAWSFLPTVQSSREQLLFRKLCQKPLLWMTFNNINWKTPKPQVLNKRNRDKQTLFMDSGNALRLK